MTIDPVKAVLGVILLVLIGWAGSSAYNWAWGRGAASRDADIAELKRQIQTGNDRANKLREESAKEAAQAEQDQLDLYEASKRREAKYQADLDATRVDFAERLRLAETKYRRSYSVRRSCVPETTTPAAAGPASAGVLEGEDSGPFRDRLARLTDEIEKRESTYRQAFDAVPRVEIVEQIGPNARLVKRVKEN